MMKKCCKEKAIKEKELYIKDPPPRPHGTIRVKLKGGGKSQPIPVEDPHK